MCQTNKANGANGTNDSSYKLSYSNALRNYGAVLWRKIPSKIIHCTISSAFLHAPPCPAAFPNELYASFTAKLAQQALQLVPRLCWQDLLQFGHRTSGISALPEMLNE